MLVRNTLCDYRAPLEEDDRTAFDADAVARVMRFLSTRPDYVPTPLRSLPGLAAELGVASIEVKDESERLGLGSFKALGGAYAVVSLAVAETERHTNRAIDIADWRSDDVRLIASELTFACATDGNHGRSVAQGANLLGARCVIFVHEGVSEGRVAAMVALGATVERVAGSYDDSVVAVARAADENGWILVSDTAWRGYERVPRLVMQGYTAMLHETDAAMKRPTHVFVQAGVGGLAAAVCAYFEAAADLNSPLIVIVEPARAACLLESARAGRPIRIAHGEPTVMAMLECYEPSLVAWRILSRTAAAFVTVDDQAAITAMQRLAFPAAGDPALVAGESGGAGLAALLDTNADSARRGLLGLNSASRVLLLNTEGATDRQLYQTLVGASPYAIGTRQHDRP